MRIQKTVTAISQHGESRTVELVAEGNSREELTENARVWRWTPDEVKPLGWLADQPKFIMDACAAEIDAAIKGEV